MQPQSSPDSKPFRERLNEVAERVRNSAAKKRRPNSLSTGELAQLRKFDPNHPGNPAVWRLLVEFFPHEAPEKLAGWACAFSAFAVLAENQHGQDLGRALAEAGYSEMRFSRLLRTSDEALFDEVRTASRFLSQKATPVNPVELALLLVGRAQDAELLRRRIARSYYRALHQNSESTSTDSKE